MTRGKHKNIDNPETMDHFTFPLSTGFMHLGKFPTRVPSKYFFKNKQRKQQLI